MSRSDDRSPGRARNVHPTYGRIRTLLHSHRRSRIVVGSISLDAICWDQLKLAYDGLVRKQMFIRRLKGRVCVTYVPGDQRISNENHLRTRSDLKRSGNCSSARVTNRMACWSRCEIQVQASQRRILTACSRLSTARNRTV
jgi:hypothetical protein